MQFKIYPPKQRIVGVKPQRKTNCAALITMDSLSFVHWLIFTIVLHKCLI